MTYVDGFVVPIKKDRLDEYAKLARLGEDMWRRHGALDYKECFADDLHPEFGRSFADAAGAGPDETVVFAYIVYESREHRDEVNAKVMAEAPPDPGEMPFEVERMVYGGFAVAVGA